MSRKSKITLVLLLMLVLVSGALLFANKWSLNIELNGPDSVTLECGTPFEDPGATATFFGTVLFRKPKTVAVLPDALPDPLREGATEVVYSFTQAVPLEKALNKACIRTVIYQDTTAPELVLTGELNPVVEYGEQYQEEGFTAADLVDGDLSDSVVVTMEKDSVIYTVKDAAGNTAQQSRKIIWKDSKPPVLRLKGDDPSVVPIGKTYEEEGFTALDAADGDLTDAVIVRKLSEECIRYSVKDKSGNESVVLRHIEYKDLTPPVLTLKGNNPAVIELGTSYQEEGFEAQDDVDGDLTAAVKVERLSEDLIQYSVKDSAGNETVIKRTVEHKDLTAPVISLKGKTDITLNVGDPFSEPGYTASDNISGDLTGKVEITGKVNTALAGAYQLVYRVADAAGNTATATRNVTVRINAASLKDVVPNGKTIYLTFDDGPGPNTDRLLAILKKYDAKATFFVCATGYQAKIKDIYQAGHAVGAHCYVHRYDVIYAGYDAFCRDFNAIQDVIRKYTGSYAQIMRFPGGSSNSISIQYCKGLMTRLTKDIEAKGYKYFDWNCSAGDSGGQATRQSVFDVVTKACAANSWTVVLMHENFNTTVDAVEDILAWGLQNGYTFRALDTTSPGAHHPVYN